MGLSTNARATEAQSLEELRNTVINLLDGLVQKGVITREQAQGMVQGAQEKAATQAKAKAEQDTAEKDAVRVTHVPEIIRQQIATEVSAELQPQVTKDVIAQAKKEKWGVPGALPEWVNNLMLFGDIRLRGQFDDYAAENYVDQRIVNGQPTAYCFDTCYADYFAINKAGGFTQAGTNAFLNTTNDRLRERIRLRLGITAKLATGISAGVRLATGNMTDPVSTNQTLGVDSGRYSLAVDQAYLRFDAGVDTNPKFPWMTVWGGRMPNPFVATDLLWDNDLQFDGVAATGRLSVGGRPSNPRNLFLTVGAFPLQEVELATEDKWLYTGQVGFDWPLLGTRDNEGRLRVAAAYYYFDNITGIRNGVPDFGLIDYTAPRWMQKGNTLFDIRNGVPGKQLYALASEYHLANLTIAFDFPVGQHKVLVNADFVTNLGYDAEEIAARVGVDASGKLAATNDSAERTDGYLVELGFGTAGVRARGDWRAYLGYRYLERDAVVDAYTDSDFHLGGTDAQGYQARAEWWFRNRVSLGLRYLSSNEIDGRFIYNPTTQQQLAPPPFGIDTVMLDVNGQF